MKKFLILTSVLLLSSCTLGNDEVTESRGAENAKICASASGKYLRSKASLGGSDRCFYSSLSYCSMDCDYSSENVGYEACWKQCMEVNADWK